VSLVATTEAGIIGLINMIDPALQYLGFSPRHSRKVFCDRDPSVTVLSRDLLLCFSAYSRIANNVAKLNKQRVDLDISRKVMGAINGMGIVKRATQKDHLTLPRIAIAFMPEYLLYRKFLVTGLQDQTDAQIDVVYKDIIFHGCSDISTKANYLQFHKEFSALIYKPKEETPLDDKGFLANYNRWSKVTVKGYRNDTQIHAHMTAAINATGQTRGQSLKLITDNLTVYKANP
jgi:hypothetical protein